MKDYGYKVTMTNPDCGHKQFVAFHLPDFLNFWQAGSKAIDEMSSQTCPKFTQNHTRMDYVASDIERGEPDIYGSMQWRDVYPHYKHTDEQEELFV